MSSGKLLRNSAIAAVVVTFGLIAFVIVALQSGAFNDLVRDEISRQARERLGARLEIGSIRPHLFPLTLEMKNVVVRQEGAPPAQPPLFRADRLLVGAHLLPLLRGRVELTQLILDQPVARLTVDAQGHSNFAFATASPTPSANGSGPGAIFDLEIQNCAIHSGELFYNDALVPLNAELHNLKFDAAYSLLAGEYKGSLSYDQGRWSQPGLAPIAHAMQMDFTATRSLLTVHSLRLVSGSSDVSLDAKLTNYADPTIEGTYQANLFTKELAAILHAPAMPAGKVAIAGTLNYHNRPQQPFLEALDVHGQIRSDALIVAGAASGTKRGLNISAVTAAYELKDGSLHVENLGAKVLGGTLQANAAVEHLAAVAPAVRIDASVRGVSLATASNAFAPPDMRRIPFAGSADLQAQASWTAPFAAWSENLQASARVSLSNAGQAVTARAIPLSGLVLVDYDARQNKLSFGQSYLQTKTTKVTVTGMLDARGGRNAAVTLNATTGDLQEVASLFTTVQSAMEPDGQTAAIPELRGTATLTATATGAANAPRIQGELTAQKLSIDGSHWRSLRADLAASPSEVSIRNASLTGESREQITFSGQAGLRAWSLAADSPISVQAKAGGVTASEAFEIAHVSYPVTGALSVNVSVNGTRGSPEGKATLTLADGAAWNEPFSKLVVDSNFHQGAAHSTANLQAPAGAVSADANYTLATQAYSVQVQGNALKLDQIAALEGHDIQGVANLSAMGSGTISTATLQASLSSPQLQIAGQKISNISAELNVAQQHAKIALHSTVDQGSVQGAADIDLTGDRNTTATIDVTALPVAAVTANFAPAQSARIGGQTEIHLTLHGPLAKPAQIEAQVRIPSFNVTFGGAQLALARPLEAEYHSGILTVMKSQIQGTGTNLTFGGTIPINNSAASAYAINADGTVDLSVLHQFAPSVQSQGELDVHVTSQGSSNQPAMQGQIQLKNAVFSSETFPASLQGLNGAVSLSGNRAVINSLAGTVGGGKISATGSLDFGRDTHFALALNAQSVRIRYPEGLRSVISAQLNAEGSPNASTLVGRVTADSLSFTQAFDLASFLGSLSEDSSGGSPAPFEEKMKVNVAIQSAPDLSLASSRLSLSGSANLNMVGTLARPVLLGRIGLTGGEIFYLSKRFELQNGTVEFANPARTAPVLNMFISTTVEQYNVTLKLTGPVDRLRTSYTSDPSMSQADIIHLLAFGNTNAEAASAPATSAASSAESVLASGVTSQLTGKFQSLTGISQLTIDPLATNTQGDPGAQIAIQQRVTGSILFTYSTNVTDTQNQSASLKYDVNKQLSVTILRDQNGGYGVDVRVHKAF